MKKFVAVDNDAVFVEIILMDAKARSIRRQLAIREPAGFSKPPTWRSSTKKLMGSP